MTEKIISINEVFDVEVQSDFSARADGFKIVTSRRTIYFLIDNYQSCCESWGFLSTPDDCEAFIGAKMYSWSIKKSSVRGKEAVDKKLGGDWGETNAEFVNLYTNRGCLTFAVYNSHNGYYSHGVYVIEGEKLVKEGYL